MSRVVYHLRCKAEGCNANYIGKTSRILSHRIQEHSGKDKNSAIQQHIQENPSHTFDFDNIEALDHANNDYKLQLKELLHVNKDKPTLNIQLMSEQYQIKTLIIGSRN